MSFRKRAFVCVVIFGVAFLLVSAFTARAANGDEINVALASNGSTISADSEWHGSPFDPGGKAPASRLIDGIIRGPNDPPAFNRWHTDLSKPHPHWVWIHFPRYARIDKMTLWRADIGAPVDFIGEYLPRNGEACRQLFKCRNVNLDSAHPSISVRFPPVVSDNFRLFITRSSNKQFPNYCQASELQVFGEWVGKPITPAPTTSVQPVRSISLLKGGMPKGVTGTITKTEIFFASPWLKVAFPLDRPGISFFDVDESGNGNLDRNLLKSPSGADMVANSWSEKHSSADSSFRLVQKGSVVQYLDVSLGNLEKDDLTFTIEPKSIRIVIVRQVPNGYLALNSSPLRMLFNAAVTPPGPMGKLKALGVLEFPFLLHFPDHGSLLINAHGGNPFMRFTGDRNAREEEFALQTASRDNTDATVSEEKGDHTTTLDLEIDNVYPDKTIVDSNPDFAGLKRGWLNIFQFRPDVGILSNNSISDNCLFCMYEYADQAYFTPQLFPHFTALDMVRTSLDRYFAGAQGYGGDDKVFMDTDPALVISSWDYADGQHDIGWLRKHIKDVEKYANRIIAADADGDGLSESTRSGISGTGIDGAGQWSSNWWDVISFGWKDAYANALDYRAFLSAADLERRLGRTSQEKMYDHRAQMIKDVYYKTFYDPATGVLAGWRSEDGKLHDYYFTFVNGIAIDYGLVTPKEGNAIMDRMQAKMREVGYDNFRIGMPGNLIPITRKDYAGGGVLGQPHKDNGSDSFQDYENGGATGSFAYFYIQALYALNRRAEANHILFQMLQGYKDGVFQNGVGSGVDWKRWDGTPCGYEGLLTDTYYAQTAFITGYLRKGVPMPKPGE